jgi:FlaA1/EpsC-like NDP-sugar epimerase
MGLPVRIDELARRVILLSGRTLRDERDPDGDIEIHHTGLRPGEKLYEELLIGKNVSGTDHPMIMRAQEHSLGWDVVMALLAEMPRALERFDCDTARKLLRQAVREYEPAATIHDLVWPTRQEPAAATAERAADWRPAESAARRLRVVPRADL